MTATTLTVSRPCAVRAGARDIIRWCFADLGMAMLFQKEFDEDG
jgi:hypothetical protein